MTNDNDARGALTDALREIKSLVCGDRFPRWGTLFATDVTRGKIADIVDEALAAPRQPGEMGAGVRWWNTCHYQTLFNAIAAATTGEANGAVGVSVIAFRRAMDESRSVQPIDVTKVPGYITPAQAAETAAAHAKIGRPQDPCDCSACVKMRGHLYGDHPAASAQQDEREAFETWAHDKGFALDCAFFAPGNNYENEDTRLAFEIWMASRSAFVRTTPIIQAGQLSKAETLRIGKESGLVTWVSQCGDYFQFAEEVGECSSERLVRFASLIRAARQVQADAGAVAREITLDDVLAWADGVNGGAGTEHAAKVTERELAIAQSIVDGEIYANACEVMEAGQRERAKRRVEVGTTGSLCDGIAWLFERLAELEAAHPFPAAESDKRDAAVADRVWAFIEYVAKPLHKNGAILREQAQALLDSRAAMSREQSGRG